MAYHCNVYKKSGYNNKSCDETAIHGLNNDCLVEIFKFLPIIDRVRIERVCRHWQAVSKESWQHVKKINGNENLWGFRIDWEHNYVILEQVLQRCGYYVTHIDLTALRFNETILCLISEMCSNLVSIKFDYEKLDPYYSDLLSDDYLAELFKKNRNLKHFTLFNSQKIQGTCLLQLSKECIQTIVITAKNFYNNDSSEIILSAVKHFTNLEILVLTHNIRWKNPKFVKSQSIITLPNSIKHLNLGRELYGLCNLNSITEMVSLEKLDVTGANVTDEFLFRLTMNCQNLETLVMDDCQGITDSGVKAVAKLPRIKVLSIVNTKISDEAVKNMRMLTELNCSMCHNIEDDGICTLLASSDSIENLNLSQCSKITQRVLQNAISVCKQRSEDVILQIDLSHTDGYYISNRRSIEMPSNLRLIYYESEEENWPITSRDAAIDNEWDSD